MTTCFVPAGTTQPEWTTEEAIADHLHCPGTPNHVLALWGDGLVVVSGSVREIRRLLERCLRAVPDESNNEG